MAKGRIRMMRVKVCIRPLRRSRSASDIARISVKMTLVTTKIVVTQSEF